MFDFPLTLFFLHLYSPFYRYCPFVELLEVDWKRSVLPHPPSHFSPPAVYLLPFMDSISNRHRNTTKNQFNRNGAPDCHYADSVQTKHFIRHHVLIHAGTEGCEII